MRRHNRSGASALAGHRHRPTEPDDMALIRTFNSETNPSRPVRPSPLTASQIQGMPLDLIDRIRSFPLFQSTPDSFLAEIGLHLRPQVNSPNDYILTEGDEAKAMYWLVRGAVAVTSRDGESTYAELKPGAFFGEIGILMDRPRTATIIARTRCLLVVLMKDDFKNILPRFPEVEGAIRDEAEERLQILDRKKKGFLSHPPDRLGAPKRVSKRVRDSTLGPPDATEKGDLDASAINKRRKSPSPGIGDLLTSSALANGLVNVRMLLKELPLFANLPPDILHFLGLNAQPRTYPPFTDIIRQDTVGREIYFIVRGDVEVLNERPDSSSSRRGSDAGSQHNVQIKARLRQGQYFGEVVSLSLAPRRTATVRSVSSVECLMISGEILTQFWELCPKDIREQVEDTARKRLVSSSDGDVVMEDASSAHPDILADGLGRDETIRSAGRRQSMPVLTFSETELESLHKPSRLEDAPVLKPSDPDPFLSVDFDNFRSRSRRGSLAPPSEEASQDQQQQAAQPLGSKSRRGTASPAKHGRSLSFEPMTGICTTSAADTRGILPDGVLISIFQFLELHHLLRLRLVSQHWRGLLTDSPQLLHYLDLSFYNRRVTDEVIINILCPFIGDRPRVIDLDNCFHITDEGYAALANACGSNIRKLKMKSVWDVTAPAILDMANRAKELREIDLSNCRKVSDTLLARIVGWLVPGSMHGQMNQTNGKPAQSNKLSVKGVVQTTVQTPAGTFFGCPYLKRLTLSYCKHVTDRSMHHIASHAASRLEEVDLTRCTTITDLGFQYWGNAQFLRLRKLCLADCTYLTDNAIVYLTNAAKGLQELDLSFCCALSDTATEVLALGCPKLTHLNLSFCGSAVSDPSLRSIGLHLLLLQELSVRGCVRVTGAGVESVVDGCNMLQVFDVSQCKNLEPWPKFGYNRPYGDKIRHETVARKGKLVR